MNTIIPSELRVERGHHHAALARRNDGALAQPREDLDRWADFNHFGRANKDRVKGWAIEAGHVQVSLERVDLAPEPIAGYDDVHEAQRLRPVFLNLAGEHDEARAGAPHGLAGSCECDEGIAKSVGVHKVGHGRAFPSRDDERVDLEELSFGADLQWLGSDPAQRYFVLLEVPLEREYTNA
jgi:hypothetical protein